MRGSVLAVVLTASAIAVAGCGPSDSTTTTTADGGKVTTQTHNDGSATYTYSDNKGGGTQVTMGSGAGANAKMPSFAPLYPGATVETSMNAEGESKGGMVMFKTSASRDEVIEFYETAAAAAKLTDVSTASTGDTMTFGASDSGSKRGMAVVATKGEDGTQVQVTWNNGG